MKTRIPSFLAGVATTLLIGALSISALAITGHMTIEIDPINIEVNGEVFQPKDAGGHDVPVFVYQGTTYAPLRALAEAYGLEVGYDKDRNLAYVIDPDVIDRGTENAPGVDDIFFGLNTNYSSWSAEEEAAYQTFKNLWVIEELPIRERSDGRTGYERPFMVECADESMTYIRFNDEFSSDEIVRLAYEIWMSDGDRGSYDSILVVFCGEAGVFSYFRR